MLVYRLSLSISWLSQSAINFVIKLFTASFLFYCATSLINYIDSTSVLCHGKSALSAENIGLEKCFVGSFSQNLWKYFKIEWVFGWKLWREIWCWKFSILRLSDTLKKRKSSEYFELIIIQLGKSGDEFSDTFLSTLSYEVKLKLNCLNVKAAVGFKLHRFFNRNFSLQSSWFVM